jgi:UDP-2-acetamido-2-deoxy-ribo-hexuluronate aminotransferase
MHHQPAYAAFCCPECCPQSVTAGEHVMSLPMSADLTDAQQDRIVAALREVVAR